MSSATERMTRWAGRVARRRRLLSALGSDILRAQVQAYLTDPSLFDACASLLTAPGIRAAFPLHAGAIKYPKRSATDVVTTNAALEALGLYLTTAKTATLPADHALPDVPPLYSATGLDRTGLRLSTVAGSAFADGTAVAAAQAAIAAAGYNLSDCLFEFGDGTNYALAAGGAAGTGETLGSELITNAADRTFSSDTGFWSLGTGVSIGGGTANWVASTGYLARHNNIVQTGVLYYAPYTISGWSSGRFSIWCGSGSTYAPYHAGDGDFTDYVTSDGTSVYYGIVPGAGAVTLSVDNVSLKQVLTPSTSGCTLRSAFAGGGSQNIWSPHASFNPNGTLTLRVFHKSRLAGSLALKVVPKSWGGADGVLHTLCDTSPTTTNRLLLIKDASNNLVLTVTGASGATRSVSGAVNNTTLPQDVAAEVVATWGPDGLGLRLNGTALTAATGTGTGLLTTKPTTLYLGTDTAGANVLEGHLQKLLTATAQWNAAQAASVEAEL